MSNRFWTMSIPNQSTALNIIVSAHLFVLRGEFVGRVEVEVLFENVQIEFGLRPDQIQCPESAEVLLLLEIEQDL